MNKKKPYYLKPYLLDPAIPTVLTAGLTGTGILFGFFPTEIRNAFPFVWPEWNSWNTFSWPAFSAWVLFIATVLLFHLHNSARDAAARQDHHEVLRLIKTMPPHNFLAVFRSYFESVYPAFVAALESHDVPIIEATIRSVLRCIGGLAKHFERSDDVYGANIMLYHRISELNAGEKDILSKRLIFSDENSTIDGYEGVVELQPALSVTTDSKDGEPDSSLIPIALPIPRTAVVEAGPGFEFRRVLPGAPYAVKEKEPAGFADTKELASWCADHVDVSKQVVKQIHDYFAGPAGTSVRSFIAIPLMCQPESLRHDGATESLNDALEATEVVLAVLNIHSNRPGLLSDEGEPLGEFTEIIGPFNVLIVELLQRLRQLAPETVRP